MTQAPNATALPTPSSEEGFQPVSGVPDQTNAATSVMVAYVLMWAILMVFIAVTRRAERRLVDNAERIEKALNG